MFKKNQTLKKIVGAITLIVLAITITTLAPIATASSPKAISQERTEVVKLERPSFNQTFSPDSQQLAQITSVTGFTDVTPRDYYFEALRNLVERYGCVSGYPDGTFRGKQPLTRGDFAVMLDSCLQQVMEFVTMQLQNR